MSFNIKKKILMLIIFMFPITIYAKENVTIECPKTVEKGEFSCTVLANTDYEVSAVELDFTYNAEYKVKEFIKNDVFEGDEENNKILLYTDKNQTGKFELGTIKFVSTKKSKPNVNISYLMLVDQDFNEHIINFKENKTSKNTNIIKYVIILIVIVAIISLIIVVVIKKRRD